MSWLSVLGKKISKIQPGKVLVNAAKSVASSLPVVGTLIGSVQAAQANREAAASAPPIDIAGTVADVRAGAQGISSTTKYVLIGVAIIVVILIVFLMVRKR